MLESLAHFKQHYESVSHVISATEHFVLQYSEHGWYFVLPARSVTRNEIPYPNTDLVQHGSISATEENARIWLFVKQQVLARKMSIFKEHNRLLEMAYGNVNSNPQMKSRSLKGFYDEVVTYIVTARDYNNFPLLMSLWEQWNWSYKMKEPLSQKKTGDDQIRTLQKGAVIGFLWPQPQTRGWYPAIVLNVGKKKKGKKFYVNLLDCTPRYEGCEDLQGKTIKKILNWNSTGYIDVDCNEADHGVRDGTWRWIRIHDEMEVCLTDAQIADVQSRMKANMSASPETIEDILKKVEFEQSQQSGSMDPAEVSTHNT
jgi:hypothetical protein